LSEEVQADPALSRKKKTPQRGAHLLTLGGRGGKKRKKRGGRLKGFAAT